MSACRCASRTFASALLLAALGAPPPAGGQILTHFREVGSGLYADRGFGCRVDPVSGDFVVAGSAGSSTGDDLWVGTFRTSDAFPLASATLEGGFNNGDRGYDVVRAGSEYFVVGYRTDSVDKDIWVQGFSAATLVRTSSVTVDGGMNNDDEARGVASDGTFLYVTGYANEASGGQNLWLGKFTLSPLELIASTHVVGTAANPDIGYAVTVDGLGNLYVAGSVWQASGGGNYWVGKFNTADLQLTASAAFDGSSNSLDEAHGLILDGLGSLYAAGYLTNSASGGDIFLVKLSAASLSTLNSASRTSIGLGQDEGWGLALDNVGRVWANGFVGVTATNRNIWLGRFDTALNFQTEVNTAYTPGADHSGQCLATFYSGNPYLMASGFIPNNAVNLWVGRYDINAPDPPSWFAPFALGTGSITWRWLDNSSNEDGFRVLSQTSQNLSGDLPAGTITWDETALSTNTAYTRTVQAFNIAGTGDSGPFTRYTRAAPPVLDPGNGCGGQTTTTVNWSAQGNPGYTPYEVSDALDAAFTASVSTPVPFSDNHTATSANLSGLPPGSYVYIRARAENGDAITTSTSNVISVLTVPSQVQSLSITGQSSSLLQWSWPSSGSTVDYRIYYGSTPFVLNTINIPVFTMSGLGPDSVYGVRVEAFNVCGSAGIGPVSFKNTLAVQPSALAASVVTAAGMSLTWNEGGNPSYTPYEVLRTDGLGATVTVAPFSSALTSPPVSLTGLAPAETYTLQVRARNQEGTTTGYGSTAAQTLPAALTGLSAQGASASSVQWSWNSSGRQASYRVYDFESGSVLTTTSGLSYTRGGLGANAPSGVRVEPFDGAGTAGLSTVIIAYSHAAQPQSLAATNPGVYTVDLSWNANGNPGYTRYEVSYSSDGFASQSAVAVPFSDGLTATSRTLSGLPAGTALTFRVRARNEDQVAAAYSGTAAATTQPAPLLGLRGQGLTTSTVAWTWDSSGEDASYRIYRDGNVLMATVSTTSFTISELFSVPLSTNARFGIAVEPFTTSGVGTKSAPVYTGTLAAAPRALLAVAGSSAAALSWDRNDNPGDTVYQVAYALDPGFATLTSTRTVVGAAASLTGLLPATTYYARVRALNRDGVPTELTPTTTLQTLVSTSVAAGFLPANAAASFVGSDQRTGIAVAAGALSAPATFFVSLDPLGMPLLEDPARMRRNLDRPPAGSAFAPGSLREFIALSQNQVAGLTFSGAATLTVPYSDILRPGFVDDASPPLPVETLRVYFLDPYLDQWQALPSQVDTQARVVRAQTPHLSVFGLFGSPLAVFADAGQARAFPVPWRIGSGGAFDAAKLTFDRLPQGAEVRLYTGSGEFVKSLTSFLSGGSVIAQWDGTNAAGKKAASGLYYAHVKGPGQDKVVTVAIER